MRKIHVVGVARHQLPEEGLLLRPGVAVGHQEGLLGGHRPLVVVGLAVVGAEEGLLDGDGPLQHGFHYGIIAAVANAADIQHLFAAGDEGINPGGVVPDHTASGGLGPAAEAAHTVGDAQLGQVYMEDTAVLGQWDGKGTVAQDQFHAGITLR